MAKRIPKEKQAKGKASKSTAAEPPSVTVTYDLFDLPTAQHKSGLAGLLLQIDSMRNRKKLAPAYRWDAEQPNTKVHIEFTAETVRGLFDDLYAAEVTTKWVRQKKPKEQLKDERTREIGGSKIKEYLYDVVRPTLPTLCHYVGNSETGGHWLRLWQGMLWAVPRGVNTTRISFEVVAGWDRKQKKENRKVETKPCPEGPAAWSAIKLYDASRSGGESPLGELDGKLWLGAQKTNAERIQFEGRVEHNMLLHFWQLATLVYVPQAFKVVREHGRIEVKRRNDGFAVTIPDIADLAAFVERFRETLQELGRESAPLFGRPQSAVVEIPAQGALSLLDRDRLSGLVQQKASGGEFRYSIVGVEYLHFRPGKNGPKMLSAGRIELRPYLAEDYEKIAGSAGAKPPYRNSLFRRALMRALVDDVPWFHPFDNLFAEWDVTVFVNSEASPKMPWFWADARKKLLEVIQDMPTDPNDAAPDNDDFLAATVNQFIRHYLDERLKADLGYDFPAYRKAKATPSEASDARRKLAERLFLEFRSRRQQPFIDHFTGTFCRFPQFMGRNFERIAAALMTKTDNIKTLTLMALSANSWIPAKKEAAQ